MAQCLAMGALLECTMGLTPSPFTVLPTGGVLATGMPVANIMDNIPLLNIMTFGLCKSPLNPEVAAIIASSLGAVTQAPCIPMTEAPWIPTDPTILVGGLPVIDDTAKLICMWGGVISPTLPGQFVVTIP